jgi:hypothetical protein
MPSPTMAVCRATMGRSRVLLVDGFDRVSRQQNHVQTIPAGSMERQIARKVNSFDYAVQHATALAAANMNFDYATNEAVISGAVPLTDYRGLVWILGEEGTADKTFDSVEQSLVSSYLNAGGNLFVSGSEIGYELDYLGAGRPFYENMLRADFAADAVGTYNVVGSGGVFAAVGAVNLSPASGVRGRFSRSYRAAGRGRGRAAVPDVPTSDGGCPVRLGPVSNHHAGLPVRDDRVERRSCRHHATRDVVPGAGRVPIGSRSDRRL